MDHIWDYKCPNCGHEFMTTGPVHGQLEECPQCFTTDIPPRNNHKGKQNETR